jgi:hypothetical protein
MLGSQKREDSFMKTVGVVRIAGVASAVVALIVLSSAAVSAKPVPAAEFTTLTILA